LGPPASGTIPITRAATLRAQKAVPPDPGDRLKIGPTSVEDNFSADLGGGEGHPRQKTEAV